MIMLKTSERSPNLAEMKVSYRRSKGRRSDPVVTPPVISGPVRCDEYLRTIWDKDTLELREEFVVLCLNAAHEVIGWVRLSTGGIDTAMVDPRLVFGVALQTAAAAIVVAHNHPSGSVFPSHEDHAMTRRLKEGSALLGIRFLDHIILGRADAYSFAREGLVG